MWESVRKQLPHLVRIGALLFMLFYLWLNYHNRFSPESHYPLILVFAFMAWLLSNRLQAAFFYIFAFTTSIIVIFISDLPHSEAMSLTWSFVWVCILGFVFTELNLRNKHRLDKIMEEKNRYYKLAMQNEQIFSSKWAQAMGVLQEKEHFIEDLKNNESLSDFIISKNNLGVWYINVKDRTAYFSDRWKEILGYKPYELPNHIDSYYGLLVEEDLNESKLTLDRFKNQEINEMDAIRRFKNKDGRILSIRVRTYPKRDENGELIRLIGTFEDVTLSEQIRKEKTKQDELFQSVFQLSLDAIIFYNHNTHVLLFNASAQTVFNARSKEELNRYFMVYVPELIRKEAPDSIYGEAHKINNVYLFTKVDNTQFWGNIIFSNLTQDGERITYIRITDINDLKMAEEKIREKEYNLRTLLDSRNAPVWMIDREYRIIDYNIKFAENFHSIYQKELKRGMILTDETPENQYNAIYKARYDKALAGEILSYQEVHEFNGRNIVFEIAMYPIRSSDKEQIIGVAIFTEDITLREENKERMIIQEQLISTINQNISEGIYRSKRSGELVYANEAFARLLGYESVAELLKEGNFRDFYLDKGMREVLWETLNQKGNLSNVEIQIVKKDGTVFWAGMSSRKILYRNQEVLVDGVIRDLTEIKSSERNLLNQNNELQKVISELDRIIHSISHEFRAPLNSLQGLISLLDTEQNEKQRAFYYSLMQRTLNGLDVFLQDTLNYSFNLSAEFYPEEIDVEETVNGVFQKYQYNNTNANLVNGNVFFNIEEALRPAFITDKRRFEIIITHLISNSIKYSHPERAAIIKIEVEEGTDVYKIKISDNGIGIEKKYFESIFKMFFRISPKKTGTGIGLYLVKEAMDKLGGTLSVESELGEGTTFCLIIPNHLAAGIGADRKNETLPKNPTGQNTVN